MARPFDNSNYVGRRGNAPCSPGREWVVVFDGAYRGCYSQQADAENAYNAISGSTGNGATAYDGATPGNAAPPSRFDLGVPRIGTPATNTGIVGFISKYWVPIGIVAVGYLVLKRR